MDLISTNRGVIKFVDGYIITITHRRGGTSKAIVDRKFTVGQVVCFTVDPVHLNITNVMLKSEADNIVEKSGSEELQMASMEGMPLEEQDLNDIDPVDQFYGKEVEDYDIDDLISTRQVSQEPANLDNGEDRTDVIREADYFKE
ncbi:hypothetical protein LCGC14_0815480 [marine sediment metagenome]|uniref:Uncharacterized protein n=1 Tax=marine sediment metagenome TaxID=412755 RepID=A0A0F9SSZ7_9ZZZZ